MATALSEKPHPLIAPLDVSHITNEKGVKLLIKRLLDFHGWFHWATSANGYGQQGVSDRLAIKDGVFLAIEAKFGGNKPKPVQKMFAMQVMANDGFAFCANEKNIDHLAMWLESFQIATMRVQQKQPPSDEHGARMLNAISVLTDLFA